MAEGLQTADGTPVDVPAAASDEELNKQFAQAMNAPEPDEPTIAAPPRKDPEAPYGRKADGTPKKGPGGRPAKSRAEKPRTVSAPTPADIAARDYRQGLAEVTDGVWYLMTIAPSPQLHAQAAIFKMHRPNLVHALNIGAQHNPWIRAGVEAMTGPGTWVATMGMALVPFALQSAALWTGRMPTDQVEILVAATGAEMERIAAEQAAAFADAAGVPAAA